MPYYDYECECGRKFDEFKRIDERHFAKCPSCGKKARMVFTGTNQVSIFTPAWFHDICEESMYITSKRQLKEECKKHNVKAARLM